MRSGYTRSARSSPWCLASKWVGSSARFSRCPSPACCGCSSPRRSTHGATGASICSAASSGRGWSGRVRDRGRAPHHAARDRDLDSHETRGRIAVELKAGDTAPRFALPDENGKTVSSDSLKGKTYFLYFYPKDDTPGCTVEACQLNDNLSQFRGLGVPVIGVSRDDADSHQAFQ